MEQAQREAILKAYHVTFTSTSGAEVLEDLSKTYLMVESHTPGDPYTTAFREGQRSIVLQIHRLMAAVAQGRSYERSDRPDYSTTG